jgi:hypothetical protein
MVVESIVDVVFGNHSINNFFLVLLSIYIRTYFLIDTLVCTNLIVRAESYHN